MMGKLEKYTLFAAIIHICISTSFSFVKSIPS
jgi:hypothetical protein